MCTSIKIQQQNAAFNIHAATILIIHYYLNIFHFFGLGIQKAGWDDHRERKGKVPYLSLFRTRAPSSSTISAPLLQPFLWRVWREQGTQMEDRSSERGKHKRTQGWMRGGRGGERGWERENEVRDDMHDIEHKNNTTRKWGFKTHTKMFIYIYINRVQRERMRRRD